MGWFRDVFRALIWALAAAGASFALVASGLFHGLAPHAIPLAVAPFLSAQWHRSRRVAVLVFVWILLMAGAGAILLEREFREFHFRAIQG